jgi:hypothetical protein
VNLVSAVIRLARVKLAQLMREVLRGPRIHVPMRINGIGLGVSLLLPRCRLFSQLCLTRVIPRVLAVVVEAQKTLLEATMALRGIVTL